MATYQREDLVRAALIEVGVLGANEAPAAEDAVLANDRAQQTLEGLYEEGLIPFDVDTDEIPARYFLPLVQVIAEALVLPFGMAQRAASIEANSRKGRRLLWKLRQRPYFGTPTEVTYY